MVIVRAYFGVVGNFEGLELGFMEWKNAYCYSTSDLRQTNQHSSQRSVGGVETGIVLEVFYASARKFPKVVLLRMQYNPVKY